EGILDGGSAGEGDPARACWLPADLLSARKPRSANSVRFHPLQQRGGVFQSLAWSADGDRGHRRLKAQEPDRIPLSRKPFFSNENFIDPQAPTSYIDVLNTLRPRHPLGFISCYNRDDILRGLERIEDDIANERFGWRENKDVELVLLALRNWGFVVPLLFRRTDWILLGELILSKVELLERDVSRLRSCKNKIDSTLFIALHLCSADSCLDRSSNDGSHLLQNAVINFGNMIIGDIAIDISTIKREISYWTAFRFLTPNDRVSESFSLLDKHVSDLSKLTTIRRNPFTCYSIQVNSEDESEKATQEFKSRSDEVMKMLVDWLAKHQTVENPLKFSQFDVE
ncbi:hypothetical protein EJB05_17440, partial [Eragrostis curvula]